MKTRWISLFVFSATLAFALTWGAAAQGPGLPGSGRANGTIARKVQQDKHLALDRTRVTQAPLGVSGTFAAMTEGKVPQWNMRTPSISPSARQNSAFSFDRVKGHFVLFGGVRYGGYSDEIWIYDGTTWTELTPTHKPPARTLEGNDSAYDPMRHSKLKARGAADLRRDSAVGCMRGLERFLLLARNPAHEITTSNAITRRLSHRVEWSVTRVQTGNAFG